MTPSQAVELVRGRSRAVGPKFFIFPDFLFTEFQAVRPLNHYYLDAIKKSDKRSAFAPNNGTFVPTESHRSSSTSEGKTGAMLALCKTPNWRCATVIYKEVREFHPETGKYHR